MILDKEITLFHGSYTEVRSPDLKHCRAGKDFGKGFYLTTDRKQAEKFTRSSVRKQFRGQSTIKDIPGFVSVYRFTLTGDIRFYEFSNADSDWLHCVVAHRKKGIFKDVFDAFENYEIIGGKIANDHTNLVITAYMDGVYGVIPSERADEIAISFLEPEKLSDQFCFRSERVIGRLIFTESYKVLL